MQYDDPIAKTYLPQTMRQIEQYLYNELENISIKEYPISFREHLGASVIGEECSRKLWYGFHWVKLEQFPGRMRRLFQRGKDEEEKLKRLLAWLGFFVREIDPVTNKQYKFNSLNGHYGGSSDSLALMPWDRDDSGQRILVEYKTHNKKYFNELKEKRLKIAQPKHFAQMCQYGHAFGIKYGLYVGVNKDDDDIYFEFVEIDHFYAEQLEKKAASIITTKTAPYRISDNPDYFKCKFCTYIDICHHNAPVEKNCRSCKCSEPVENGQWKCNSYGSIIPSDFIIKGCERHVSIAS